VQLYVKDLVSTVTVYESQLRGFERIFLMPGETKTVSFILHPADLKYYSRNNKWVLEPGVFELLVGSSSVNIKLHRQFTVQ